MGEQALAPTNIETNSGGTGQNAASTAQASASPQPMDEDSNGFQSKRKAALDEIKEQVSKIDPRKQQRV